MYHVFSARLKEICSSRVLKQKCVRRVVAPDDVSSNSHTFPLHSTHFLLVRCMCSVCHAHHFKHPHLTGEKHDTLELWAVFPHISRQSPELFLNGNHFACESTNYSPSTEMASVLGSLARIFSYICFRRGTTINIYIYIYACLYILYDLYADISKITTRPICNPFDK